MVEHGRQLVATALALTEDVRAQIATLTGLHVLHEELIAEEASHDLDPMHVLIDVSALGISGYQAADWLREHHRIDMGLSDHRRIEGTLSMADDTSTPTRLVGSLSISPKRRLCYRGRVRSLSRGHTTSNSNPSNSPATPSSGPPKP
jgi:arginine decarboxylase